MKSELTTKKLADVIELVIDNRGRNPKSYEERGIPIIDNFLIKSEGKAQLSEVKRFINEETYDSFLRKYIKEGDVLMTLVGNGYGKVATTPKEKCAIIQNTIGLRCNDQNDNQFLYYLLRNNRGALMNLNRGAAQPSIKVGDVLDLEFKFPSLSEQKRVAGILKAIDEKIELNTQTNQTLEQIAQAIFKSWFVDFDPVKAKIETLAAGGSADDAELAAMSVISAKTLDELNILKASNPEAFNKLAQTATLFPAAMQDSELGEIPEGWEVSDLASCTTELRRGISPKYIEEGGVLVINQKCIRNHTVDFSLARRNDSSKRKVDGREIAIGDVLVNSTGVGTLGRLAPIRFLNETTVADSHVTVVRANTTKISKSFLAGLMLTNEAYIEASGAGSTGQTELRKQVLEDIRFAKPLNAVDKLFDEIVSNFNEQIAELEKQKVTLSLTRNALLPKLLSGELVGE